MRKADFIIKTGRLATFYTELSENKNGMTKNKRKNNIGPNIKSDLREWRVNPPIKKTPFILFEESKLYTKNQCIEKLNISLSFLNRIVKEGSLPSIKIGRSVRFQGFALNLFIQKGDE